MIFHNYPRVHQLFFITKLKSKRTPHAEDFLKRFVGGISRGNISVQEGTYMRQIHLLIHRFLAALVGSFRYLYRRVNAEQSE